jgi:formylglycine-generating enzyme
MLGNVWEWVEDWWGNYGDAEEVDPKGPPKGTSHILRGGSWFIYTWYVRASCRYRDVVVYRLNNIGFRCAGEFDIP